MLAKARLQTIICCLNLDVAQVFYCDLLGLPVRERRFNGLVLDVDGADLWLCPVPDPTPSAHTVIGFAVADVAAVVAALAARGLAAVRTTHMNHDAQGIVAAPDGSRVAWLRDPDGNFVSLVQLPPPAHGQLASSSREATQHVETGAMTGD